MTPIPPDTMSPVRDIIPHSRPSITDADVGLVAQSVVDRALVGGPVVSAFEEVVAGRSGTMYGCAVSSGTAALHLVLSALGIGPGDEVVMPSYVCAAPLYAVRYVGARAVLCDVDPETGISQADHVRAMLTKRTRAVIVVHLLGRAAPVHEIGALGIPVIEDCAQALGGNCGERSLGSWGIAGIFSFYATKVITTGYGGMVCSNDPGLIETVRDLTRYDERTDEITAYTYGMTAFQAALGTSQMSRLDEFLRRRREIYEFYSGVFSETGIRLSPAARPGEDIHYRFIVKDDKGADRLISDLSRRGIVARRPVYRPLWAYTGTGEMPGTMTAHHRDVSIPLYPALTDHEMKRVAEAVVDVVGGRP